jgi:predicted porin
MLVEWGGDGWNYTDNFMTGRTNGVLTYRNSDFFGLVDGLSFALQYQGKNDVTTLKPLTATAWHLWPTRSTRLWCRCYSNSDRTVPRKLTAKATKLKHGQPG